MNNSTFYTYHLLNILRIPCE